MFKKLASLLSIDMAIDFAETTPLNNLWKTRVKGLMDWSGAFGGNYDPSSAAIFNAGTDTGVEYFYLYPLGSTDLTKYYYGTCWVQPGKLAAGSTTTKASGDFKVLGQGALSTH